MKVLVTGGGTREPIDGVRFITNFSTGETAAIIADELARAGHEVTGVFGLGSVRPARAARLAEFGSFADLDRVLRELLAPGGVEAVIHLAAVSDYSVGAIESAGRGFAPGEGKLASGGELVLRLKPNFKIVERLKSYAPGAKPLLIAFKLTRTPSEQERLEAVRKLAASGEPDYIVHNDLGDREAGSPAFRLFNGACQELRIFRSREELAQGLAGLLRERCG
ncbi:MAG: DNA/pantothenate metabolism flavoprotein [Oligoflexia bacterium]|nr:DNA/pantothenate metabolism flavoprotein [Oligoflexia bacterium]